VAENQPTNKHRVNPELSKFAARLREAILSGFHNQDFDAWASELFHLQFHGCPAYQAISRQRGIEPASVAAPRQATPTSARWKQIPSVPTAAFKHLELSSIPAGQRTAVFFSSGTTDQMPSRHFHNAESLALYEASLWRAFCAGVLANATVQELLILTPGRGDAPNSSLVHMFETVRQMMAVPKFAFAGKIGEDGAWDLDFNNVGASFEASITAGRPLLLLGTAFSFVHLLDHLAEKNLRFELPAGSRVMETGGYKNRSRVLPKAELHRLITARLGVPAREIICEYGMSELSSQAYDVTSDEWSVTLTREPRHLSPVTRHFSFPPWARAQIISPETGREVAEGETGLIRIFDLANVFSVAAIQTEDLGIRRGDGFELIGRAQAAEPRGCSLMNA
jgi:hypothetical protein